MTRPAYAAAFADPRWLGFYERNFDRLLGHMIHAGEREIAERAASDADAAISLLLTREAEIAKADDAERDADRLTYLRGVQAGAAVEVDGAVFEWAAAQYLIQTGGNPYALTALGLEMLGRLETVVAARAAAEQPTPKRPYVKPELEVYGTAAQLGLEKEPDRG